MAQKANMSRKSVFQADLNSDNDCTLMCDGNAATPTKKLKLDTLVIMKLVTRK